MTLPGGYELDDDRARLDLDAAWDLIERYAYCARSRTRDGHGLYAELGFGPAGGNDLERPGTSWESSPALASVVRSRSRNQRAARWRT